MKIASYLRLFGSVFILNVQAAMEYRLNFALQTFGMMLNNAAFAVFWGILIGRVGSISGYGFNDIMFIWAIVSSSFGLSHILAGNAREIGRMVQKGELDVYLLQPRNVYLSLITSKTVVSAFGDLFYGYLVLAFLPGTNALTTLLFTVLTVSGALVFTGIFAMAETLVFWLGSSEGISMTVTEFLISFSLYPETIFAPSMRWVFYSILPSGFIAFIPLSLYKSLDWSGVPWIFLAAMAYFALSCLLFAAGLRRYESGNQMGARI